MGDTADKCVRCGKGREALLMTVSADGHEPVTVCLACMKRHAAQLRKACLAREARR